MDLIDKIEEILHKIEELKPIIDLHYDNQKNVVGYITDEKFNELSDEDSQKLIWGALKKNLESSDLIKIVALFHETPLERVERLNGYKSKNSQTSNFWFHQTPELAKYWLFIDIAKFQDDYKSFFLVISEKNNINKALTFVYNKEVLEFMELEQDEIYNELYSNTFENAEAEIKLDLMNKYEELLSQQLYGKANMYWYIYENFKLTPKSKNQLFFTNNEISMIENSLKKIDNFSIKNDIELAIKKSLVFNTTKIEVINPIARN